MNPNHYTYRVTWSPEDNEHLGLCTEFPSLSWLAATPEEALTGILQLVREVVIDMQDNGEEIPVHAGSGNIFSDLGRPDAKEALARVRLAQQIAQIIERKALSQTAAAELMGLDRLKVSALVRGRLSGFSTDRLLRCLMQLGQDVDIVVRDKPSDHTKAHISVVTAADLEDLYLAEQRLIAVRAGNSKTHTLDEVERNLGLVG